MSLLYSLAIGLFVAVASTQWRDCPKENFECDDGTCIHISLFCDGYEDCSDGSDEPKSATGVDGNITLCRGTHPFRPALCALPLELERDRNRLCREDSKCPERMFECDNGTRCIDYFYFCNGRKDCRDQSDEPYAASYQDDGTLCRIKSFIDGHRRLCILPTELQQEKQTLCNEKIRCSEEEFECHDSSIKCIHARGFCNGLKDCGDGSDENTSLPAANSGYRTCFGMHPPEIGWRSCRLKEKHFCDGEPMCAEGADEGLCGERKEDHIDHIWFRCIGNSATTVAITKVCDGKFDCPDMTDECLCQPTERPKICERMEWDGREPYLLCNETTNSIRVNIIAARMCDLK